MSTGRPLLAKCEIFVYFAVYIVYIGIGLYKIYALRDRILDAAQFQFADGWQLFQRRRRDDSNDELANFGGFMATYWPFYLLHVLVGSVLRWKWPRLLCQGYAAVCALALGLTLHWSSLLLFAALISSYYLVAQQRSKRLVWLLSALWLLLINVVKVSQWWYQRVGYAEYVLLIVTLSWNVLRGCSYALAKPETEKADTGLAQYLGYVMYFPCLTFGPFISYQRFVARQQTQLPNWRPFLFALLRVAFWWLFMQGSLHYLYIHYMARDVRTVAMMGSVFWQHAVGYFMGQFFFLFYVVTYGLGIAFAQQDGIPAPRRPRCIGRIHFYSDMWKYFDEGLYEFLFRHIYAELCGKQSSAGAKFGATCLTFAFVFVWHGCYTYVLIWSVLNCFCLAAEKVYRALVASPSHQQWMQRHLGAAATQRMHALLATQLFIPAAFSNVYFIGGKEVGDFLMRGAYSSVGNYLALCFCTYCFFQCSELLLTRTKTSDKSKTKAS